MRLFVAVFEVGRVPGPGFLEKVYEDALLVELRKRGLKAQNQVPIKVNYKGHAVGGYVADIIVEDVVLLEFKKVESLDKAHEAQRVNYLKATGMNIGLLVNFKAEKAQINRMVLGLEE